MGLGPSKEKIRRILEKSIENTNWQQQTSLKIEYKFNAYEGVGADMSQYNLDETKATSNYDSIDDDSFINSREECSDIMHAPEIKHHDLKKFPYIAVGALLCYFEGEVNPQISTCFMIDSNVVVTLACNIRNTNYGHAKKVLTTFSGEEVKKTNIYYEGEGKKEKDKSKLEVQDQNSKLAVILYEENIGSEWLGVEQGTLNDFEGKDKAMIFVKGIICKNKSDEDSKDANDEDESGAKNSAKEEPRLVEVNLALKNTFEELKDKTDDNGIDYNRIKGSPIYYKDFNGGSFVIAIINDTLNFQCFDKETMMFLCEMTNKGKLLRKKVHKGIDEENIVKLDLSRNDFGPLDIKYLTDFDLKSLRILDLSSNSIKPQGAFYLSQGKFSQLESLNLNFNEIGDEGMNHIATGAFNKLNCLYLFHNNISKDGIQHLAKADFANNLVILSLSENPQIGDTGVRIMKDHKCWGNLNTLNLNSTGLTDLALNSLGEASFPKLRKLNLLGNKFTAAGKPRINGLRMNHVKVCYKSAEDKAKERKELEKKKKEKEKEKK